MADANQHSGLNPAKFRGYAERSKTWTHGDKTEDELLQRVWNLSDDVLRLLEQLESVQQERSLAGTRIRELQEQLHAAEEAAQKNWDEHSERQLAALDKDPERKARLAAERERDGLLEQVETLRTAGQKALHYADSAGYTDATFWVRDLRAAVGSNPASEPLMSFRGGEWHELNTGKGEGMYIPNVHDK